MLKKKFNFKRKIILDLDRGIRSNRLNYCSLKNLNFQCQLISSAVLYRTMSPLHSFYNRLELLGYILFSVTGKISGVRPCCRAIIVKYENIF